MADPGRRRRRDFGTALHALSGAVLVLVPLAVVAAAGAPGPAGQDPPPPAPRPADVIPLARLTPDARITLALGPGAVATDDAVWTPSTTGVTRIDAKSNIAATGVTLPASPCASLVVAFGSVWAPLCASGTVARVELKSLAATAPLALRLADAAGHIATSVGSVWVASEDTVVSRVDPDTNAVVAEVFVARGAAAIAAGEDALWISSAASDTVTRVNPHNNLVVETVKVGPKPGRVVVGEGGVWTLNRGDGSVSRIDPTTNKVVATVALAGAGAGEIAVGAGSVWVSAPGLPLARIDPKTNRAAQRFTGDGGGAVLVAHGSLWVAAGPAVTWRLDPVLVTALRPE